MSGTSIERSPYEAALGDVLDALPPGLRPYFAAVPPGEGYRAERAVVSLVGRWVVPERLLRAGYRFEHPDLEPALRRIVPDRSRTNPQSRDLPGASANS